MQRLTSSVYVPAQRIPPEVVDTDPNTNTDAYRDTNADTRRQRHKLDTHADKDTNWRHERRYKNTYRCISANTNTDRDRDITAMTHRIMRIPVRA